MGVRADRERPAAVGRSVARIDGADKARGALEYPQDLTLPEGCLYAATVRAPLVHARVLGIDAREALATPGVVRVLTSVDVGGSNRFGLIEPDQPVLVEDRVRGASDVLALVVGTCARSARAGAAAVRVDLRAEPLLTDPEHACDAGAPIIHPERAVGSGHANLLAEREIHFGDATHVARSAPVVIEGDYRTETIEHAFMAPEAGYAEVDGEGRLVLHVATQWPPADLRQAAVALGEPVDRLRMVQAAVGGAFGGREDISLQILLLLAARETGSPVCMAWSRAESIRGHGKRHPFRIRHRLAADKRGKLLAAVVDVLIDAGCYASTSAAVLDNALSQICGPYAVDHLLVRGRAVYTNNPFTCAMRGFGVNQVTFAMEQQLGKLAERIGADPAVLRSENFARAGARFATGPRVESCAGSEKTLGAVVSRVSRRALPRVHGHWRYGRGLAAAMKNVGYGFGFDDHSTASVTITGRGATVRVGAAEVGQGVTTVLAQIAAEVLALPLRRVRMLWQDTAEVPDAGSSSASRQTYVSGNAVRRACELAMSAVAERGGLDTLPPEGITRAFTFHAPATEAITEAKAERHAWAYSQAACVADVRVDAGTGRVQVLRVINALDPGRAINPKLLEGQVEGGVVMGYGYALQERCALLEGVPSRPTLEGCGVATAVDADYAIETIIVESAEPSGPFGARGIGEITMFAVVPAITAAIHDAVGVWIDALPASPERIATALITAHDTSPSE
jgi:CO/xanthine dehydrogenase Mo-binding subunit